MAHKVANWRRRTKERLVEVHGNMCVDCKQTYPPYIMDFDHRDPSTKEFKIGSGNGIAYEKQLAETMKCDLVCSNCHRERTHKQRCSGCKYCDPFPDSTIGSAAPC